MKLCKIATSLTVLLLISSGCSTPTPAEPESAVIDKTLPVVTLTKNGAMVDMKSVAFEWNSIANPKVKGVYVYKKVPMKGAMSELKYFTTIESRYKTHYVDNSVEPDTRYSYAFQTFSADAQGQRSREVVVNTLPVLTSVSWIHSITGLPRAAKIIWRPHSNEKVKAYIMERKTLEDDSWKKIATIEGRLNAEYIDKHLHDNYVYMYRLRAVTYDGIISTPSEIVKVVTKALPQSIQNIKATTNIAHKITITWDASKQADFSRYYLYRSKELNGSYELIAKLYNNHFTDKISEDGQTYFYRVAAVDKDGLESISNTYSIQGMTLSRPKAPAIVEAKIIDDKVKLSWSKTDPRSVSYVVVKKQKKGWFKETTKEFKGIQANSFIDKNIEPDSTYTYVVKSVDTNALHSNESAAVKIITPESQEILPAPKSEKPQKEKRAKAPAPTNDVIDATEDVDLSGL